MNAEASPAAYRAFPWPILENSEHLGTRPDGTTLCQINTSHPVTPHPMLQIQRTTDIKREVVPVLLTAVAGPQGFFSGTADKKRRTDFWRLMAYAARTSTKVFLC